VPIVSGDIKYRLSGGAGNADPDLSLGGVKSSTDMPADLFDDVSSAESSAGDTEYRCVYIHNNHGTLSLQTAVIWIQANTASTATQIAIGVGTAAINGTEQTVANESTAPTSVTFSEPTTFGAGLALGTLPAGQHKAVWVRRIVDAAAGASNDTFTLRVQGDTAA
jgi:hypothetical protein